MLHFEPKIVWQHFDELLSIPRCSKCEEKMRRYLEENAKRRSIQYATDAAGNIVYYLPTATHVQLTVYNLLGQKINSIVNKNQPAGTYQLTFEANHLSSGVYFIELKNSDGMQQIRKALLLK